MKKTNYPLTIMADGKDAVIIIHNILEDESVLNRLYENLGQITDAALAGLVEAEPITRKIGIDTSDVRITEGQFAGRKPSEVTAIHGDKAITALAAIADDPNTNDMVALAIRRELFAYTKKKFQAQDAEKFSESLSEKQCMLFFKRFDYVISNKLKGQVADEFDFDSYESARDFSDLKIKRLMVKMIIESFQ